MVFEDLFEEFEQQAVDIHATGSTGELVVFTTRPQQTAQMMDFINEVLDKKGEIGKVLSTDEDGETVSTDVTRVDIPVALVNKLIVKVASSYQGSEGKLDYAFSSGNKSLSGQLVAFTKTVQKMGYDNMKFGIRRYTENAVLKIIRFDQAE